MEQISKYWIAKTYWNNFNKEIKPHIIIIGLEDHGPVLLNLKDLPKRFSIYLLLRWSQVTGSEKKTGGLCVTDVSITFDSL